MNYRVLFVLLLLFVSVCVNHSLLFAQEPPSDTTSNYINVSDPLEWLNRPIHSFNMLTMEWIFFPLSDVYDIVTPEPIRSGISNIVTNLDEPISGINYMLQFDVQNSSVSFGRFVLNSTIGVLGIFDPASHFFGLDTRQMSFSETLHGYGVGTGPYLVLPILGSSSVRDLPARAVDAFIDPMTYVLASNNLNAPVILNKQFLRISASKDTIKNVLNSPADDYSLFRDIYFRRMNALKQLKK